MHVINAESIVTKNRPLSDEIMCAVNPSFPFKLKIGKLNVYAKIRYNKKSGGDSFPYSPF